MYFSDEFEYEATNGMTFYIEVDGEAFDEHGEVFKEIKTISISNDDGEIDNTHECYNEVVNEVHNRDYEVEVHSSDFEYYNDDVNNFLKEK